MHSEQAHGLCVGSIGRLDTAGLEGTYQGIGCGVTPTVDLQGSRQQGLQIGQHILTQSIGRSRRKARQHIAVLVDGAESVVRRKGVEPIFVLHQGGSNTFQ